MPVLPPAPDWERDLPISEFISYAPSYEGGKLYGLFDENIFSVFPEVKKIGRIKYYLYDPKKHGADPKGTYPLLVFFHGLTNALAGKDCISYCGGELFASPEYQKRMGGAYVLIPIANEREEGGKIVNSWSEPYINAAKDLVTGIIQQKGIKDVFAIGGSLGGWFTWRFAENFPVRGLIPAATDYVPSRTVLRKFEENNVGVIYCVGRRDEFLNFKRDIEPLIPELESYKNMICLFPEWVRNGDGGVASVYSDREIGQHCFINQIQADLLNIDGKPYDKRIPKGVTGWIKAQISPAVREKA